MGGDAQSNESRRTTAKSGCRTCKIRKVKCDELYPACRRCISSGRECDGYGVWGGGGNFYSHRQRPIVSKDSRLARWPSTCASTLPDSAEESQYLEWFNCRTMKKIPGPFAVTFWNTLLLQASLQEPAVLHAVLTLSSVHRWDNFDGSGQSRNNNAIPDEHEQFMLQHYIKAIRHLQPHFFTKDRPSIRVALITCVVFICLELLRGHFKTAQIHLQNGLKVLRESQGASDMDDGILVLKPSRDSIDDWIGEVFSRLQFQLELFNQSYRHPCFVIQTSGPESPLRMFYSINEAWQQLERLLSRVFNLTEQAHQQQIRSCSSTQHPSALLRRQQQIRAELTQWLASYNASEKDLQSREFGGPICQLLCVYHTMARIMAETCLCLDDESRFDPHTEQFVSLLNQSIDMWKAGSQRSECSQGLFGHYMNMSRSMIDIGWIPPLYYIALKCRVHRIRLQAIRLLESASHREGIWDSKIAACVARKVMEIEEGDFYGNIETNDAFPLSSSPGLRDLSLPTIPQSYRIRELKVVLSDGPVDSVHLLYRREQTYGDWEDIRLSECPCKDMDTYSGVLAYAA